MSMTTFKITSQCFPIHVWPEPNKNISTTWSGHHIWMLLDLFRMLNIPTDKIEVVPRIAKLENSSLHPFLQQVAFGESDYALLQAGFNHKRFKDLDFSPVTFVSGLYIFSRNIKAGGNSGDFLSGMFDSYTYCFILASTFVLWAYFLFILKEGPFTAMNNVAQLIFNKGGMKERKNMSWQTQLVFIVSMFANLLIAACFSGQIIAQLLAKSKGANIRDLSDLEARPWIKVIVNKDTFIHTFVLDAWKRRGSPNFIYARFFVTTNTKEHKQTIRDVLSGDYVLIADQLMDLSESMCSLGISATMKDVYQSPTIAAWPSGNIFPKIKNELVQKVYDSYGWLNSFDLYRFYSRQIKSGLFRNSGSVLVRPGPSAVKCDDFPVDTRDQTELEIKEKQCKPFSEPAAKKIELEKLKLAFYILMVGLGLACCIFGLELRVMQIRDTEI